MRVPELAFLVATTSLILSGEAGGGDGGIKLGTVMKGSVGGTRTEVGETVAMGEGRVSPRSTLKTPAVFYLNEEREAQRDWVSCPRAHSG